MSILTKEERGFNLGVKTGENNVYKRMSKILKYWEEELDATQMELATTCGELQCEYLRGKIKIMNRIIRQLKKPKTL